MIKEDDLGVLFTLDFGASANALLFGWVQVWVDINYLSVTTVPEKEAGVRVCVYFEIRRVCVLNLLTFPRVITQISNLRLDLLSFREDKAEVLVFHAVS